MYKMYKGALTILLLFSPSIAFAETLKDLIGRVLSLVNPVIALLSGLALIFFLWGLVKFVFNSGNEQSRQEGKQVMLWGIIAIFIMVSVWGIVQVLQVTIFGSIPPPPFSS